jgi:hypothetical protein
MESVDSGTGYSVMRRIDVLFTGSHLDAIRYMGCSRYRCIFPLFHASQQAQVVTHRISQQKSQSFDWLFRLVNRLRSVT